MVQDNIIQLNLPANFKHLNVLSACIASVLERVENLREKEALVYNIQLAVQEACTNIVRHAYAQKQEGRIKATITLEDSPQRFIIDLIDTGTPFVRAKDRCPNLDEPQIHGYGLFLMRQLLDEVNYISDQRNNHWHLVKVLQ